eukprot:TRINITY_DN8952_c0_g1_i4.p1 TRINITY_DN8952_c0_g1~~TRINITY_DN8952_c0_g1_i4.p1  ORF type:complete len:328 (+),score=66.13 TRINITY_DN8952_c0_g1_i4:46-1029(+)
MAFYHPMERATRAPLMLRLAGLLVLVLALWCLHVSEPVHQAFAGAPLVFRGAQTLPRSSALRLFATDLDDEYDDDQAVTLKKDYTWNERPPEQYYKKYKIDRHKVNMVFFDQFAKPREFFPQKLRPGDTVRISYIEARPGEGQGKRNKANKITAPKATVREAQFDGIILNFRGDYHARTMTVRAMLGKGLETVGYEFQFPIHSPLITKIQVLRRGYIGRNKNAYFLRGMIGKKNVIPLDQERTEMDKLYENLKFEGKASEIPEPEYPAPEWDTYPLPVWKQDMPDWDEEMYNPDDVDQRSDYETRVIAKYRMRPSRTGHYGATGGTR